MNRVTACCTWQMARTALQAFASVSYQLQERGASTFTLLTTISNAHHHIRITRGPFLITCAHPCITCGACLLLGEATGIVAWTVQQTDWVSLISPLATAERFFYFYKIHYQKCSQDYIAVLSVYRVGYKTACLVGDGVGLRGWATPCLRPALPLPLPLT